MGKKKKTNQLADHLLDEIEEDSGFAEFSLMDDNDEPGDLMSDSAKALWGELSGDEDDKGDPLDPVVQEDPDYRMPDEEPQFQSIGDDEATMALNIKSDSFDDLDRGAYSASDGDENTIPLNLGVEDSETLRMGGSITRDTYTNSDEKTIAVGGGPVRETEREEKVSFGFSPGAAMDSTPMMGTQEAALVQAENLRIAQQRILSLEKEVENLRRENEQLSAAGESLKRRADELSAQRDQFETQLDDQKEAFEGEITILRESLNHKDKRNTETKQKVEELEIRLNSDLKKIRMRERELEHRLELVKMENEALARNKDETILGLKRQHDQLNSESEGYRSKMQELYKQLGDNQDRFRRTVRALRLALSNLELADDGNVAIKKAE